MKRKLETVVTVFLLLLMLPGDLVAGDAGDVLVDNRPIWSWISTMGGKRRRMKYFGASVLMSEVPASKQAGVVPLLAPYLESERDMDRWLAALILGEYGPVARSTVPDLVKVLKSGQRKEGGSFDIQTRVPLALGKILKDAESSSEVDKVVRVLIAGFSHEDPRIRRANVYACGLIGPAAKACVPHLGRMLQDPVRSYISAFPYWDAVAWTCGRMGKPAAEHMNVLLDVMLRTESPDVLEAVGAIGPVNGRVVPRIVEDMKRVHAGKVKIRKTENTVPMSRAAGRAFLRKGCDVLAGFGPAAAKAKPFLKKLAAGSKEPEIRKAAKAALAKVGKR